jgi:hydroxymethylglutaryl-CoA lyase
MSERLEVRDCGPRDGLQPLDPVPPARRAELANALFAAGLRDVEVASFVSPRAVPAMADAAEVVAAVPAAGNRRRWALVPNLRGAQMALEAAVDALTVTLSLSEAYSRKNVGMSTDESMEAVHQIWEAARDTTPVDVIVSCCFGSPFDDVSDADQVGVMVDRLRAEMRGAWITLADTTGTGTPRRVKEVLDRVGTDVGLHLHDSRGTALLNALTGYRLGVRRFDTSVGGLGGSPFAPSAGGNLATEDLVVVFEDEGIDTGIDLDALLAISRALETIAGQRAASRVSAAGGLPVFG